MSGKTKMHLGYPVLEMYDETYTSGEKDLKRKEEFGHLIVRRSNTVGHDYLLLMTTNPRKKVEWIWAETERVTGRPDTDTSISIWMHAKQVRRLRDYLTKWLDNHRKVSRRDR